ncbi:MAG: DUF4350 domain-containing protein [Planctomycetaceae bacterium]
MLWLAICLTLIPQSSLFGKDAASESESAPVFGWRGHNLVGRWSEVRVPVNIEEAGEYAVHVTAPDPDGHRVTFVNSTHLTVGKHSVPGYFKVGQLEPTSIEVNVIAAATKKPVWTWKSSRRAADQGTSPLHSGHRLIVTVGDPSGFDWGDPRPVDDQSSAAPTGNLRPIAITVDDLPVDPRAYDSISILVIAGRSILSADQAAALRDWVMNGGRVVISLPMDLTAAKAVLNPIAEWLPATLAQEPLTISELGKIELFAGRSVRIPMAGRMRVPGLKIVHGEVLSGSRDEAIFVRTPFGKGSVTLLTVDLTQPPLSKWTELSALTRKLSQAIADAATQATTPARALQLSSTGVTDLATQLHAVQENFPSVYRASPWVVMGLLVAILLVVGPLDYLIVHRLLKRPRATWLTLPLWVLLAGCGSAMVATQWNGNSVRINQLNLVNYDVATSSSHQKLWTNVYSPATERRSFTVESSIAGKESNPAQTTQSGWSGIAETAYGGMLRRAGVNVGAADYVAGTSIEGLPLLQWSSKPLLTEVRNSVEGMVEADLKSNGVGQVSGTISHRFGGPIEDWFLAYGNRVYRHKKTRDDPKSIPLKPRQTLRIDQPTVFPRELRAYLIGKVATSKTQPGESTSVSNQYSTYDQMSRDPLEITRILTFHTEADGSKYTGLTNRLLEDEDLSHLLGLGRAILFGRLDAPVASVRIDGTAVPAERETTFIRIILPVTKTGSDISREIERFDKVP